MTFAMQAADVAADVAGYVVADIAWHVAADWLRRGNHVAADVAAAWLLTGEPRVLIFIGPRGTLRLVHVAYCEWLTLSS
jgi:hypothetical protein